MAPFKNIYQQCKEAYSLLKKEKYSDAILILERVVSTGIKEPYPHLILAIAYLFANKINKIGMIMNRIRAIDPGYFPYIQYATFLQLKSAVDYEIIMDMYIDLLNRYPADPYLNRARRLLSNAEDNFVEFQKTAPVQDFVHITKPPRHLKKYNLRIRNRFSINHFEDADLDRVSDKSQHNYAETFTAAAATQNRVLNPAEEDDIYEEKIEEINLDEEPAAADHFKEKRGHEEEKKSLKEVFKTSFKENISKEKNSNQVSARRHNLLIALNLFIYRLIKVSVVLVFVFFAYWAVLEFDLIELTKNTIDDLYDKSKIISENANRKVDMININENNYNLINKINKTKTPIFYYSADQVSLEFDNAKKLIKRAKYNESLSFLNRIFNSNANLIVKEKVDFLIKFVIDIEERAYEKVPYKHIAKEPYLYRGYSIKWNGRVANLKKMNDKHSFTLMVDFKENKSISGLAEVYSNRVPEQIQNGKEVEVDAVFYNKIGKDDNIYIVAREVRMLNNDEFVKK